MRLEDDADTLNDNGIKALFLQHRDGNAMDYIIGIEIYDHLEKKRSWTVSRMWPTASAAS